MLSKNPDGDRGNFESVGQVCRRDARKSLDVVDENRRQIGKGGEWQTYDECKGILFGCHKRR